MPDGQKIHLYCLCWNDARMLPFFFQHYDTFVDQYFIYDNGSTDESLSILSKRPNVHIEHFDVPGDSFVDEERRLGDTIWKGSEADWAIVTDIDEHIYHPSIRTYLDACKRRGITAIQSLGYEMVSDDFPTGADPILEQVTLGVRSSGHDRLCIFNPRAITETNYSPGRHQAAPEGNVVWPDYSEILLLHFKQLGPEYPVLRSAELMKGIKSRDLEQGWGIHYSWSADEIRNTWQVMRSNAVPVPGLGELKNVTPSEYTLEERTIKGSGLIDEEWYLREYPDVEASNFDPVAHYCIHGWEEGRRPNFYFDPMWYLDTYSEQLKGHRNPLFHYITQGEKKNAWPSPTFNTPWYRKTYKISPDESPLRHYLQNRKKSRLRPIPAFNVAKFWQEYPDEVGPDQDPFEAYCRLGLLK